MIRSEHPYAIALTAIVIASLLPACGSHTASQHSQVVARVNDQDVTLLQLNQVLQSSDGGAATPETVHAAIDSLVDEELLVQQAVKVKLDRDPAIVQAMERSRRQLLAQAYAEKMLYPKERIALAEEESYYKDHPALFENRKLYRITAFTIKSADLSDRLNADLDKAHSVDEVRNVLEKHEIQFETQQLNSTAEEMPLDKVDQFSKAHVGDLLVAAEPDAKTVLMSLASIEERPLTFERAKPLIEQYLLNVRDAQATTAYLQRAKLAAKITYSPRYNEKGPSPETQSSDTEPGASANADVSIASGPPPVSGASLH